MTERLLRDIRVTQKALGDDDRRSDADTAAPGDVKTTSLGMECSFALLATGSYPALKSSRKIQQRSSTSRGGRISGIEAFVHDSVHRPTGHREANRSRPSRFESGTCCL
jgi:hypothetical protein